jgi:tetratricopeptide (TPR) repeat protein
MNRRLLVFLLTSGLLIVLAAAGLATERGIVRVPPGSFAISGARILEPGWHLTSPSSAAEILSQDGAGALPPLPVSSREGVRGTVLLRFRFHADPSSLARAALERRLGFHVLMEATATTALQEALANRSAAELLDHQALDAPLTASVSGALEKIGVGISDFRWEVRLPEDFTRNLLRSEYASRTRQTGIHLLLIGLDAADWEIIDPLLAQGRLPSLKRLIDRGVRGPMRSYNPMISPMLWTTVATGKGPDLHGVADFTVVETKSGARIPIGSRYRKVKSLWNVLTDFSRPAAVVGWWASFPADRLDGYLVSDRVAALSMLPDRESLGDRPGYTFPASYLREVLPRLSTPAGVTLEEVRRFANVTPEQYEAGLSWVAHPPAPPGDKKQKLPPQDPVGLLIKILTATRNYEDAALDLLSRGPFDLAAVYFEGVDLVEHRFQHYLPPKMEMVSDAEYSDFHRVVTEFYVHQDRIIGELLEKAGPGATVLVLSDHGFKTGTRRPEGLLPYTVDQPVEWHREYGIFILSGPGAARGELREPATLFDVAPTVLALLGLPVAGDMPGRVLSEALDPGFLSRFPPEKVPSYEGVGAPRETEGAAGADEVSAEMVAQLRALGYVGADFHNAGPSAPDMDSGRPEAGGGMTNGNSRKPEAGDVAGAPAEDTPVTFHRNMATYYLGRKEYAKAIGELVEANRREKLPKTYAMLAESLDALGKKKEAIAALEAGWKETAKGMEPDSILWYVQLAVDTGDSARGAEFLQAHQEALKEAPAIRDAAEGRLAEAGGRREEARRLYEKALKEDPTLVGVTRQLVELYRQDGRMESIRPILEAGLKKSERIDEYHNLLGALDSAAGRKEEALVHFRRAAELNPGDSRFTLNLGLTLTDLRRMPEAEAVFERAIATTPGADLYLGLGNARLLTRQPDLALAAFQKAREMGGPASVRAELGIALSYLGLKRADDALAFARESLARNPDNPPLRNLYQDLLSRR